jgi:hypothetical protein
MAAFSRARIAYRRSPNAGEALVTAAVKLGQVKSKVRALPIQRSVKTENGVSVSSESETGEGVSLAVPRRGHVLSTVIERYGKPIREAVAVLADSLEKNQSVVSGWSHNRRAETEISRSEAEMAAWAMVSMWVVGIAVEVLSSAASLADAELWFSGSKRSPGLASARAISSAEKTLRREADASAYFQLLPYILDPHGPGSRLSVRRDPTTHSARNRKRAEGVFYTPADVAEYMAAACLAEIGTAVSPGVFDPACGTGVFLRAALHELQKRSPDRSTFSLASECLFGADIDPWPLDAAAFVLLADSWQRHASPDILPVDAWRRLRMNLSCTDTLLIDPAESVPQGSRPRIPISTLFPALKGGPTLILGNPPYADLGRRSDVAELGRIFASLGAKPEPSAEIYLAFVEQMIRLANSENCSGALVLPLSLACNVGVQFSKMRELISRTRGCWRFAFFDREPHALFGEDVKTRNAIVLWSRTPANTRPVLCTGPLRKWRGNSRAAMFRSLRFTAVDADIRAGIPKIDGPLQAAALKALSRRWGRLEQVARNIERVDLADVPGADDRTVFLGATAYNFVNVFLRPPRGVLGERSVLSEHPLHAVRCASRTDARAVFAVLSSHLAYWWWHTHGDGFHVSRRFIAELPFGIEDLSNEVTSTLAEHGEDLWAAIKSRPIISLNRGSTSLAFTPKGHDDVRRKIDETLAALASLEGAFVDELQQFTAHTVTATVRVPELTATEEKETA